MHRRRSLVFALIAALLITLPLMALLYLAEQSAELPFVPFDLFDWIARTLPGDVITQGIDTMVEAIDRLNLGETSSAAKTLETIFALLTFLGLGAVLGAGLYLALERLTWQPQGPERYLPGALAGAVISIPFILISIDLAIGNTPGSAIALWLMIAFAGWGLAIHWMQVEIARRTPITEAAPETAGESEAAASTNRVYARQVSRRDFLIRVGGTTATLTVIGAGIGRYLEWRDEQAYQELIEERRAAVTPEGLPNAGADVEPAPGTRPEYTPLEDHYRIDINVRPPELDGEAWRLNITGLVDNSMALSLDDLRSSYEAMDQYITLSCISNPIGGTLISTTRWTGVPLQDVLADAGLQDSATHIKITSADGFFETVALDLINNDRRIMLAYNWDGIPLLYKHGFPLRIYIPDRYGMKQPKWITDIEVMDHDEDGYWVERGWSKTAIMKTTSVVDVAASDRTFEREGVTYVPVGGIAHAGARGISKVEVSIDGGDWVEAQLRQPLSDKTWVIWRYDWPFDAGRHSFEVRCYDGEGNMQITEKTGNRPDGATGIHSLTRTI